MRTVREEIADIKEDIVNLKIATAVNRVRLGVFMAVCGSAGVLVGAALLTLTVKLSVG